MGTSMRITPAKKRIKAETNLLPAPKSTNLSSVKHESDNSDYSHTTDDNKQPNIADMDYNRLATPVKTEPVDVYEVHHLAKKKM